MSSNQTCAATHLPIQAGDPIVALLIVQQPKTDGTWQGVHYTGGTHLLASLPFHGVYDDAGGIEQIDDAAASAVFSRMRAGSLEAAMASDEDELPSPDGQPATLIMIHAEAWGLLSEFRRDSEGRAGAPVDDIDGAVRLLDLMQTSEDGLRAQHGRFYGAPMLDARWSRQYRDDRLPMAAHFFSLGGERAIHPQLKEHVLEALAAAVDEGDIVQARTILMDCARLVAADEAMMGLRRGWAPQIGLGSQHTSPLLQIEMAEHMLEQARSIAEQDVTVVDEDKGSAYDDMKVAFGIEHVEETWQWCENNALPEGWSMVESDTSGARAVAIFRVEGPFRESDARTVRNALARIEPAPSNRF